MNEKIVARWLPITLAVFGVVQADAAECFVSDRTFPSCAKAFDSADGVCPSGNRVEGYAQYLGQSCDPATKFVEAYKLEGTGNAFVFGVTSAGAAMSNCMVVVSSPDIDASQHHKASIGGCGAAVKWRIRMFD